MTKKLTSQKSPIWQKLNLSPVGCCGDWSGPPTYSLTIIIVFIIFALVTTSQLYTPSWKKKHTDHHDRWMLSWWCDRECQHIQLHYSLFLCKLKTLHPPFLWNNSLHIRSPESGSTRLFLCGMKGIHAKNVWCCGVGYFGQKKFRKKCVNRDKI